MIKDLVDKKENSELGVPPVTSQAINPEMKRKATIRIPCEQYAFIELNVEETPEDIIEIYKQFISLYKGGLGIADKEFNEALDRYLAHNTMDANVYASMNKEQQTIVQSIKRAFKRILAKYEREKEN